MKKYLMLLVVILLLTVNSKVYAGGCAPASTNTSCATATTLTPEASCINGTTCGGGTQSASSCLYSSSQCSWYSFTATGTNMYVSIDITSTSGCHISSNVYRRTGACSGLTEISCQSGAPLDDLHALSGLTIGNIYYIQVCYSPGGPCGNGGSAEYCINVGVPDPPCNTCNSPCGTASGFATAPTVQQVVDTCQTSPFAPALQQSSTHTFCYNFRATATSVDFNVIITSNCSGGNVTGFSWSLYNATCGGAIQTGTLASLTLSGLTVGNDYVFCYTFTVPATCTHSQHCPYFVGATVLPITLIKFDANYESGKVNINWITASEINNDYFTIERSKDLKNFEAVGMVKSKNGNSNIIQQYNLIDKNPLRGTSYYRLKQTDYDGNFEYFEPVAVTVKNTFDNISIYPNPVTGNSYLTFNSLKDDEQTIIIYDVSGRIVYKKQYAITTGNNKLVLETINLIGGMYFMQMDGAQSGINVKFVKE